MHITKNKDGGYVMFNLSAIISIECGNMDNNSIRIEAKNHQKLSLIENYFFFTIFITYIITTIEKMIKYTFFIIYSPSYCQYFELL